MLSYVSVLFNEPKLLKLMFLDARATLAAACFSALQRAEIAEIVWNDVTEALVSKFQCSSTSRNC